MKNGLEPNIGGGSGDDLMRRIEKANRDFAAEAQAEAAGKRIQTMTGNISELNKGLTDRERASDLLRDTLNALADLTEDSFDSDGGSTSEQARLDLETVKEFTAYFTEAIIVELEGSSNYEDTKIASRARALLADNKLTELLNRQAKYEERRLESEKFSKELEGRLSEIEGRQQRLLERLFVTRAVTSDEVDQAIGNPEIGRRMTQSIGVLYFRTTDESVREELESILGEIVELGQFSRDLMVPESNMNGELKTRTEKAGMVNQLFGDVFGRYSYSLPTKKSKSMILESLFGLSASELQDLKK